MARGGWTKQQILDTIQHGRAFGVINKATGGAAIEYLNPSTGRFVVVDATTGRILQISRSGMQPKSFGATIWTMSDFENIPFVTVAAAGKMENSELFLRFLRFERSLSFAHPMGSRFWE
jgi:hypothetical protein